MTDRLMRLSVTNNAQGARTVYTTAGQRMIKPGQTLDAEFTEAERDSMRDRVNPANGGADYTIKEQSTGGPGKVAGSALDDEAPDFAGMKKAELVAYLTERDGEAPDTSLKVDELRELAMNAPEQE